MADIRSFFGPPAQAVSSVGSKKRAKEPNAEDAAVSAGSKKPSLAPSTDFAKRVLRAKHGLVNLCIRDVKDNTHTEVPSSHLRNPMLESLKT